MGTGAVVRDLSQAHQASEVLVSNDAHLLSLSFTLQALSSTFYFSNGESWLNSNSLFSSQSVADMAGFIIILGMAVALGVTSFGIGMLPLFFTFSKTRITYLSTLGTGLLIGAALGIIIPEGVETLVSSGTSNVEKKIALSLVSGFALMLVVEKLLSGHSHWHDFSHKQSRSPNPSVPPSELHLPRSTNFSSMRENGTQANGLPPPVTPSREGIDLSGETDEIDSLEDGTRPLMSRSISSSTLRIEASKKTKALPMTLGLVIHSLADGLALGAAASSTEDSGMELSIVVFLALIIHKAPTALALSMSLISSLSPAQCRLHLAVFSLSTPLGAIAAFGILFLIGAGKHGGWTGIALLVSGGTFLYVATVLQPVSHQDEDSIPRPKMNEKIRVMLILVGMFVPFLVTLIASHTQGH